MPEIGGEKHATWRVSSGSSDDRLRSLIVERGVLTSEQIRQAASDPEMSGQPLASVLTKKNLLTGEQLSALLDELAVRSSAAEGSMLGRFRLVRKLGEGGMGEVWLAEDLPLGREVALKLLLRVSGSDMERFMREGKLAAKLNHPHIVQVYDMGQVEGRHYISMQYVKGEPLQTRGLTPRQVMEVMADIADAVQFAHENGVIHRDIKPENILVGEDRRVYLSDFGLAKGVESSDVSTSRTGAVLGTLSYMSPEAARGQVREIGPLSDVYSLGATLYHLLSGREPFAADSFLDVVRLITTVDPPSLRTVNPNVAPDIQTIVSKAMDKDPARRYGTAGEFAADIRRFLAGEPIVARPPSIRRRILRRLKRNPLVYSLVGCVAVALFVAGGIWVRSEAEARRLHKEQEESDRKLRAERASAMEMLRETARTSMAIALSLRRKAQNEAMHESLALLKKAYEKAALMSVDSAEVDYLMGRMHRALMQDDEALRYQEKALAKDSGYGPSLYERAVLNSKRYGRLYRETQAALKAGEQAPAKGGVRQSSREEVERAEPRLVELREKISGDLARLETAGGVSESSLGAARGILAHYERREKRAREELLRVVETDPRVEEAWEILAESAKAQSETAGTFEESLAHWKDSESFYSRGLENDRGYVPHWLGRAEIRFDRAVGLYKIGRPADPDFTAAEADLAEALRLDARSASGWTRLGSLKYTRAYIKAKSGEDPRSHFDSAEKDILRAVEIDPKFLLAHYALGLLYLGRGQTKVVHGQDPFGDFDLAEKELTAAIELDRGRPRSWLLRGMVRMDRGSSTKMRGQDPSRAYDDAEKDLNEALRLDGAFAEAWIWRAATRMNRGIYVRAKGSDPLPHYADAEKDYGEAIRLQPVNFEVWMRRGLLRVNRGIYRLILGQDPSADFDAAEGDLKRALEILPENSDAYMRLGLLWQNRGDYKRRKGDDPVPDFTRAVDNYTRAVELNPKAAYAWKGRGVIHSLLAGIVGARGDKPKARGHWGAAARDLAEAIRLNPSYKNEIQAALEQARRESGVPEEH